MVEKRQHQRFVEIFHAQFLDGFFPGVGRVAQQQSEGVAVSQNGIGGKTFLDR